MNEKEEAREQTKEREPERARERENESKRERMPIRKLGTVTHKMQQSLSNLRPEVLMPGSTDEPSARMTPSATRTTDT